MIAVVGLVWACGHIDRLNPPKMIISGIVLFYIHGMLLSEVAQSAFLAPPGPPDIAAILGVPAIWLALLAAGRAERRDRL